MDQVALAADGLAGLSLRHLSLLPGHRDRLAFMARWRVARSLGPEAIARRVAAVAAVPAPAATMQMARFDGQWVRSIAWSRSARRSRLIIELSADMTTVAMPEAAPRSAATGLRSESSWEGEPIAVSVSTEFFITYSVCRAVALR